MSDFITCYVWPEQELCLNIIPTFANLIDYPSMKNSLIPRIKSACLQTSSLAVSLHLSFLLLSFSIPVTLLTFTAVCFQVRVNSLVCLGKILEYLDKWYVIDEILPFLQQIPSREPAVLMGILGKDSGHTPPPNSCKHCLLLFDFPTPSLQESISAPSATRSWVSPKSTLPPRACPTLSLLV